MSGPDWRVRERDAGVRLDKFLAASERLGSRSRAVTALERGKVFVNDREVTSADAARRLASGDAVRVWMDRPGSSKSRFRGQRHIGGLRIVYEDDAIVVVDKPAGLLAVPLERRSEAASVQDELRDHFRSRGKRRALLVHRIDRDTSGLVVFAVDPAALAPLKDQFRRREAGRVYLAVVYGEPTPAAGTWRDHLTWDQRQLIQKQTHARDPHAKEAQSEYRVLERFGSASLIEVTLITGRRNQIRLQARLRGHMLVGEQRYVFGPTELRPIEFPRQALHAHRLSFVHPLTGQPLTFQSPLPTDMLELVARLRRQALR